MTTLQNHKTIEPTFVEQNGGETDKTVFALFILTIP